VLDRYQRFQACFGYTLRKAFGSKLNFSSSYHPGTNEKTERANQFLVDMLRACVLEFQGKWKDDLPLMELSDDNNYQSTIKIAAFEACIEGIVELLCAGVI